MRKILFESTTSGAKIFKEDNSWFIEYWNDGHTSQLRKIEVSKEDAERASRSLEARREVIRIYDVERPKGLYRLAEYNLDKYRIIVYKNCKQNFNTKVIDMNDCKYDIRVSWKVDGPYKERTLAVGIDENEVERALLSGEEAFALFCERKMVSSDFEYYGGWWSPDYKIEFFSTCGKKVLNYGGRGKAWNQVQVTEEEFSQILHDRTCSRQILENYL